MTSLSSTSINLRFGWRNATHQALIDSCIEILPIQTPAERRWKAFLKRHETTIKAADGLQDAHYPGPAHYVDMLERGNKTALAVNLYDQPCRSAWENAVNRLCRPAKKSKHQPDISPTPSLDDFEKTPNLIRQIETSLETVRKLLQQYTNGQARIHIAEGDDAEVDEATLKLAELNLAESIGALTHYMGDASSPPHTVSAVGDWPLLKADQQRNKAFGKHPGIHAFLEEQMASPNNASSLRHKAIQAGTVDFSSPINPMVELIQPAQSSSALMPDVYDCHQASRRAKRFSRQCLGNQLEALLLPHLLKTVPILSRVLHTVYHEAGAPALPNQMDDEQIVG